MKKLLLDEIKGFSTAQIIDDLRRCKYSLLECAGCHQLRAEMKGPGAACRMIVNLVWYASGLDKKTIRHDRLVARRLARLLSWAAPAEIHGKIPQRTQSLVVGFNHPSLGEIIRFLHVCLSEYGERANLFPVNLPWFEALMPVVDKLERVGIYLVPIITPSTFAKMGAIASVGDMQVIEQIRKGFSMHYLNQCVEFAKKPSAIWVAPSATRRATVFRSVAEYENLERPEPPAMSLIATSLMRAGVTDCEFLACGVIPPPNYRRGLNLLKRYTLCFAECYGMTQVSSLMRQRCEHHRGRMFEYEFLQSICHALTAVGANNLLYP